MGNKNELILVHRQMDEVSSKSTFDIMLTPQFYTLKREPLPVKYAYQAKGIAPSLFDGLLDEKGHYDYFLQKEEEGWLFIAYNAQEIKAFLRTKGIKPEQVKKIYFMQQSFKHITAPLELTSNEALVLLDDTVVVVPQVALDDDEKRISFNKSFKPSRGVTFSSSSSADALLSPMQSILFGGAFLLFAGVFIAEGLRYGGDSQAQEEELSELFTRYPSLKSSYSRNSIASKYKKIDKVERHKREVVKSLSTMVFKGSTLASLKLDNGKFVALFDIANPRVKRQVMQRAKAKKFRVSSLKNSIKVEGAL